MKNNGLHWSIATTLISGVAVFANAQLIKGIDPIVHTTIKNSMVGIMVISWMIVSGKMKSLLELRPKQWMKLLLIAVIGGSVSFGLFFTGLKIIGASEGALIHKTLVVWVVLLAIPFLKEKVSIWMMLAALGLYASNFIGSIGFTSLTTAHFMILAATLLWASETILIKKYLKTIDVTILLFGRMGIGSGLLIAYLFMSGKSSLVASISAVQWQGLLLVSALLFGYVMTWYRALKYASAIHVSTILVGATVITTALSGVSAGKFASIQLIQSAIISVIISSLIIWINRSNRSKQIQSANPLLKI